MNGQANANSPVMSSSLKTIEQLALTEDVSKPRGEP